MLQGIASQNELIDWDKVNVTNVHIGTLGKRHISILSTRNVTWTFFWRPPNPSLLRNVTLFFRLCETPEALLILQALRLMSVVHKRIKVHLGQGQNLIVSIKIYLKYKYTDENAGFCVLCIDDFKILKNLSKLSKFFTFFTEKRHRRNSPPPPPNVHMTFLVDKIDMWRFP